jgi:hypothetical protein
VESSSNTNQDYDILEVPGLDNLKIAVIPSMLRHEDGGEDCVRSYEWTVCFGKKLSEKPIRLYGWYAESERETGVEVGTKLFTDSCIKHSELVVVILNGVHLAKLENFLHRGELIENVIITRLIKLNEFTPTPVQINTFQDCYISAVQQYLDYIIVRVRIEKKIVVCRLFDQKGTLIGADTYEVDFRKNTVA